MAVCIVKKFEDEDLWAVSRNDSMFSPTFTDELAALLFAAVYQRTDWLKPDLWAEAAQVALAADVFIFVDDKFPLDKRGRRAVPAEWSRQIAVAQAEIDGDDVDVLKEMLNVRYSYDNLVEDANECWKRGRVNVLELLVGWFKDWQKGQGHAAI